MNLLEISNRELSQVADDAISLAKSYWASLDVRPAYPSTSGKQTTELFSRPWPEHGRGQDVLQDFTLIAEHVRPSTGRFFGYVVGSGEPIGALGEFLALVSGASQAPYRFSRSRRRSASEASARSRVSRLRWRWS